MYGTVLIINPSSYSTVGRVPNLGTVHVLAPDGQDPSEIFWGFLFKLVVWCEKHNRWNLCEVYMPTSSLDLLCFCWPSNPLQDRQVQFYTLGWVSNLCLKPFENTFKRWIGNTDHTDWLLWLVALIFNFHSISNLSDLNPLWWTWSFSFHHRKGYIEAEAIRMVKTYIHSHSVIPQKLAMWMDIIWS